MPEERSMVYPKNECSVYMARIDLDNRIIWRI